MKIVDCTSFYSEHMMYEIRLNILKDKVDKFIVENCSILIKSDNSIPKAIYKASEGKDLVVLGHRKQSFFKENFFDSIDEGIVNKVLCPVLVIPK